MKIIIAAALFLLAASNTFASDNTHKKLVAEYIKASRAEQMIGAEIDTVIRQFTANASPEEKAQMARYINDAMGWNVIKNQFTEIMSNIYTTQELKAALAFKKTPIGDSITIKNIELAQQIAALMSKNMVKMGEKMAENQESSPTPDAIRADTELVVSNIEEHSAEGKTYFTGVVENHGKKPRNSVQVEVNLFMAGKFVDQYSTYISGKVTPAEKRYFKISCGCKDAPPAPHDSYKIQVIEGY